VISDLISDIAVSGYLVYRMTLRTIYKKKRKIKRLIKHVSCVNFGNLTVMDLDVVMEENEVMMA